MANETEDLEHTPHTTYTFDPDAKYPLVVQETAWTDSLRLDVRTYYTDKETGELRPTQKGVSLTTEKAAWLLPLLTQFVAANSDVDDSAYNAIEASFAVLQAVLLAEHREPQRHIGSLRAHHKGKEKRYG